MKFFSKLIFLPNIFLIYKKCPKTHQLIFIKKTKKRLEKKARERYQDLSEKEKNEKRQYGCEWYEKPPDDEKQMLVEHRTN